MRIKDSVALWFTLLTLLLGPLFTPKIHLFYCAPYLIISLYRLPLTSALWRAYACGILIDLLSSSPLFGLTSLNYCFAIWLLHGQTRHFFEDKLSTLPLMTFLFSLLSTVLSLIFAFFSGHTYPLSKLWAVTDLIMMPLADALYALLLFSFPFELIYRLRKLRLFKKT